MELNQQEWGVAIAKATMQMWEERTRSAERRVYGIKAICEALATISGAKVCMTKTKSLVRSKTFPWSFDRVGRHVVWWELERWMRSRPDYEATTKR